MMFRLFEIFRQLFPEVFVDGTAQRRRIDLDSALFCFQRLIKQLNGLSGIQGLTIRVLFHIASLLKMTFGFVKTRWPLQKRCRQFAVVMSAASGWRGMTSMRSFLV